MVVQQRTLAVIAVAVLFGLLLVPAVAGGSGVDSNPLIPDTAATHTDNDTTETVVVRFSNEVQAADLSSTADLQAHAADSQEPFADAADESPYVEIQNSFWIANAMVIEYNSDVLSEDDITAVSGVDYLHPNFEVSVDNATASGGDSTEEQAECLGVVENPPVFVITRISDSRTTCPRG